MAEQITIDVSWWQAVFGLALAVGGIGGMVGLILRLWMAPQVGEWIDKALERERRWVAEQLEVTRQQLRECQSGRQTRLGDLRHEVERIEGTLAEDVREIRQAVRELSSLVPEMAGVKAELSALREQLRGHHRQP
jgi:methyl-accepting chemotaxis protein